MIISSIFLLLLFDVLHGNINDQYHLGVINHHTQWQIHCPNNSTRKLSPPINNQPLISYQCPHGSLPLNIIPIEIDLTLICRSESRLIWIIVDVYQYNEWLWSNNAEQLNISIEFNEQISIKEWKSEVKHFQNRLIMINAFYIPFESLTNLFDEQMKISIRINQCYFHIEENSTWNDLIINQCHATQSKSLLVQSSHCHFTPKFVLSLSMIFLRLKFFFFLRLIPVESTSSSPVRLDEPTTDIPDFHVILSIDEQQTLKSTTESSHTDYYLLFNEHYKNLFSTLTILIRASNLLTYVFIFTIIIFILLLIFFLYVLCYHYHTRSKRRTSSLVI